MKKTVFLFSFIIVTLSIILVRCKSEDDLVTKDAIEGGLVEVATPAINYVVGNTSDYKLSFRVFQGDIKVKKLFLYKSFYSVMDDTTHGSPWSNEVLQTTIDITEQVTHYVSTSYFYADLIDKLAITRGNKIDTLPKADTLLNIGDYFKIRVETEYGDGKKAQLSVPAKLTVSTRFAGEYKFVEGAYYRIGVLANSGDYWAPTYKIESVDVKTYKMFGLSAWPDNSFYFQIESDMSITYPLEWQGVAQKLNGNPLITCTDNATDFVDAVNCGTSNIVVKDDVNGKDRLYMTLGYYTSSGDVGPRVFYQVFEKVTE